MTAEKPLARSDAAPLRRRDGSSFVRPGTLRAVRSIAEALFSKEGAPPPAERLAWLEGECEDFLARCGAQSRFFFSLMVGLVSFIAPLFLGRLSRLGALSVPDRVRAMARLERRFGEPLLAVKAILCLLYYEHPDASREMGFDGQCLIPRTDTEALARTPG